MPLDKQTIPISFSQGIDTKSDSKQLSAKLTDLQNGIFQTGLEIRKRNGYTALPSISAGNGIAAYQNELVSLNGANLYSYNSTGSTQTLKGSLPTVSLSTQTVIRTTTQQTIQDSAINGTLTCFVWFDGIGQLGYSIFDTTTGQSIVNNQVLSSTGTRAKVLALGSYFVVVYYDSTPALKYKAINISTPTVLPASVTIASDIGSTYKHFDASVINSKIYVAYQNTDATHVSLYSLTSGLVLSSQMNVSATALNCISIFGDASFNVWVAYSFNTSTKVFIVNAALSSTVLAPTVLEAVVSRNITGVVSGTTASVFYEEVLSGTAAVPLNVRVKTNTITLTGTVGSATTVMRGVGLASKVFTYSAANYLLVAYQSSLQSSYFVVTSSGAVIGKLSPSEGGGWTSVSMLPEMNVSASGVFQTASLIKDLLTVASGTIATQTGVISATFTFTAAAPSKFILGQNLHFGGAQVNMYDGSNVVEHGFHLYPEGVSAAWNTTNGLITPSAPNGAINQFQYSVVYEWTDNQGQLHTSAPSVPVAVNIPGQFTSVVFTGVLTAGSATIASVPSTTGLQNGMYLYLIFAVNSLPHVANFPYNATITSVSSGAVTMSSNMGTPWVGGSPVCILATSQPISCLMASNGAASAGSTSLTLLEVYGSMASNSVIQGVGGNSGALPTNTYASDWSAFSNAATLSKQLIGESPTNTVYGVSTGSYQYYYMVLPSGSMSLTIPTLRVTNKQNVSLAIYRTECNGSVFYRTSSATSLTYNSLTADSVSFTDTTIDSNLVGNEQLYSTGEVENIGVPAVSVASTFKSRAIVVPSENQLSWWYSKQVIPGSPVEFSDLFVNNVDSRIGSITAIGVLDDKLILAGPNAIFYVVGDGPAASGANNNFQDAQLISSDVGCSNQASMVLTPDGLMFQSPKGIYLLDRSLSVKYIGAEVEAYNSYTVTSAQLMKSVNQVRFTISSGQALVYDYYYRQWSIFTNHSAVDSCLFKGNFTFISSAGAILTEAPGVFTDNGAPVLLSITSNWLSFANVQGFQRIWQFLILGEYKSPHTITVNLFTDYSSTAGQIVSVPWTSTPSTPYQYRVFVNNQKCETMQVQLVESQTAGSYGEGLVISAVSFLAGMKRGSNTLPPAQSFG